MNEEQQTQVCESCVNEDALYQLPQINSSVFLEAQHADYYKHTNMEQAKQL